MKTSLNIVKALADGNRMRVIAALLRKKELCVCQIVELLRLATPTVSRHMFVLQAAHLVQSRKDGRWVYYSLSKDFPEQIRQWFEDTVLVTEEIRADQALLEKINSCSIQNICQQQKKRKEL